MATTSHDTCVSRVPIFRRLSPAQQLEVSSFARPTHLDAGQVIYAPGQSVSQLMVVHGGTIKISHLAPSGSEQILRVVTTGDVVGESAFLTGQRPDHYAVAITEGQLCVFDHAELAGLVGAFPDIALGMLCTLSQRLTSTERLLAAVTSSDVGARVAAYLLDLPGSLAPDGSVEVQLPLAKKDVASYLGTTPETLSRRLATLADRSVIRLGQGRSVMILDIDALERAAAV